MYTIIHIPDFEKAKVFAPHCDWCICQSEFDYETYTLNGETFYFCLKKGFEKTVKRAGNNYPYDDYGVSMLAISVDSNGQLANCTNRWNVDRIGNPNLTVQEISQIVGRDFYETFKPIPLTANDTGARKTHSQSRFTVYLNKKYQGKFKAEEHPRSKSEWSSKDWDAYMFNDGVLDYDEAFADLNELLSSDSIPRQHIVFLTGAGVSAESGLETFRGEGGMWTDKERIRLSSAGALYYDTEKCLNFYNALRKRIAEAEPNEAHRIIAWLEEDHEVTVITQNVDNLHERAGSSRVIHLHGELTKVCSSNNRTTCIKEYPLDVPIRVGDKAEDGSQLRPNVVMFGEYVGDTDKAVGCISNADIFVVIGTSFSIHPAGGLIRYAHHEIPKFVINPEEMEQCVQLGFTHIKATATEGMLQLIELLNDLLDPGSEPIQDMEH